MGRNEEAVAKLAEALKSNPHDLGLLMLSGIIHELVGDIAKARDTYGKVLATNPRFAAAANNVAWPYRTRRCSGESLVAGRSGEGGRAG
jgi:Flp pilus assembly protein TadD